MLLITQQYNNYLTIVTLIIIDKKQPGNHYNKATKNPANYHYSGVLLYLYY